MINAIVHTIASNDEVGVDFGKGASEPLGDIGSGEGMSWFGEASHSFRRKS